MRNIYAGVRLPGLQATRKRRQVIQFFKPPASRKNKHADTSLNMPAGSYHIQLSNGGSGRGGYIIQGSVFASSPPLPQTL